MKRFFKVLAVAALIAALLSLSGAAMGETHVAALKGPTGMGMAHMIENNDGSYAFTLAGAPDELTGGIINGSIDIAAVPTNLAAVLYNKTKGGVKMLALNTLGVLYVLEKGDTVHSAADLTGKTIVSSGQGSTPDYVLNYILKVNGVTDAVIDWRSEHSEVNGMAVSGRADIVMLPEPYVTALLAKDASFRVALDLTEAFSAAAQMDGKADAVLSMGCVIARTKFIEENPDAVKAFMADCAASIQYTVDEPDKAAEEIAAAGVMASAAVARSALPKCHLTFIAGGMMRGQIEPLFNIFFENNPASVGGALPGEDFYYIAPSQAFCGRQGACHRLWSKETSYKE